LADDQKIVRVPPEMLGLQMDFHHHAVMQDWRDAPHEELGEPVGSNVLLKERARSTGGGGT
jgi:hypothetical protein